MLSHINDSRTPRNSLTALMARPWATDPDELGREIQKAVSSLSEDLRAAYSRRLITTLSALGLDVRAILYVSGVVESEPEDLTPAEIAHLFRYLRLNLPWALVDAGNLLEGLETRKETRKAA